MVTHMDGQDCSLLVKTWMNTNENTRGIRRVSVADRHGSLWVRIEGAGGDSPRDWGEVPVDAVYAAAPESRVPMSFNATFDLGSMRSHVQANVNQGLLVMVAFNSFTDDSGRAAYFSREFFHEAAQ